MPWVATSIRADDLGGPEGSLLHLFADQEVGGWSAAISSAAAVVALYLIGAGVAVWIGGRASGLPIGAPAVLAAYFAVAITVVMRTVAPDSVVGAPTVDFHYARGAYLGVAAGVLLVVATIVVRRPALPRRPLAPALLGSGMAAALLIALLLPWERVSIYGEMSGGGSRSASHAVVDYPGVSEYPAAIAALLAIWFAASYWSGSKNAWRRVMLACAAALFTIGAFSTPSAGFDRAYGAWTALGIALALVPLAVLTEGGWRSSWVGRLRWRELALAAATALFLGSLFLPWRNERFPLSFAPDPRAGHSVSLNAWILTGAAAAAFAMGLLAFALRVFRGPVHPLGLAAGTMLFAAAVAVELTRGSTPPVPIELGYGAFVGLACATAAIGLVVLAVRFTTPEWRQIGARSIPVLLCLAYISVVMIPPLFEPSFDRPTLFFAPTSWLTVAGVVVAIRLIESWVEQNADQGWLVVLPVSMLSLAVVDVIRLRHNLAWGAAVVVGISVVLAGLGRFEQRGGGFRIPEVLRIDRI